MVLEIFASPATITIKQLQVCSITFSMQCSCLASLKRLYLTVVYGKRKFSGVYTNGIDGKSACCQYAVDLLIIMLNLEVSS